MKIEQLSLEERVTRWAARHRVLLLVSFLALMGVAALTVNDRFQRTFDSVAELVQKANPYSFHKTVTVLGYYTPGDGGGGTFVVTNTVTGTNIGTRIYSGTAGLSWERVLTVDQPWTPLMFGARCDLTNDDSAAIQAAVNKAAEAGGTVDFGSRVYSVTNETVIASKYPVHLEGKMFGYTRNGLTPVVPGIRVIKPFAGWVFKTQTPTGNRDDAGGVTFEGLSIRDDTYTFSAPGTNAIEGAINVRDANMSSFTRMNMLGINGSAVKTEFCVMTAFDDFVARFCGATNKPVIWHAKTDVAYVTQSVTVDRMRLEHNFDDDYMRIDAGLGEIKIRALACEAETSLARSSRYFLNCLSGFVFLDQSHFNRNAGTQLHIGPLAQLVRVSNTGFRASTDNVASVVSEGIDIAFNNCFWNSGKPGVEIDLRGARASIFASDLVTAGSIRATNGFAILGLNRMVQCSTTNEWMLAGDDSVAGLNILFGDGTGSAKGIRAIGTTPKVIGNGVSHLGGVGIRTETVNAVTIGNTAHENGGGDYSASNLPLVTDLNFFASGDYLQGTNAWGPFSLAAGATLTTNITVADARVGDTVAVGFTTTNTPNTFDPALQLHGEVYAVDTVRVTAKNDSGSTINITNGVVKAKVRKMMPTP